MPIVPSRARQVQELIAQLDADAAPAREAAAARLALHGPRAVLALLAAARSGTSRARVAALGALEAIADPRAWQAVASLAEDPDAEVAARATLALGAWPEPRTCGALGRLAAAASRPPALRRAALEALETLHRGGALPALEQLLERLMDEAESSALRLRALQAVSDLPRAELAPLLLRLQAGADASVAERARALAARLTPRRREAARQAGAEPGRDALAEIEAADASEIPALAAQLARRGELAALPVLKRVADRLAAAGAETDAGAAAQARAAVHRALGALDSRIALYDLRELLAARPERGLADALEAARLVGDASLLPALIALAEARPAAFEDCSRAFAAVVAREGLTRRSRALRVREELRPTLDALWARLRR